MRVKVTTFKPSGKYYTHVEGLQICAPNHWEMIETIKKYIREERIPGLEPGARQDFHVLVEDLDSGIPYLFPLGQKEVL